MNIRILLIALCVALLGACSDKDTYTVEGQIEGEPTMNLRVTYYANDALQTLITASEKGHFKFSGSLDRPTVMEIYDNDYRLLGRLYVGNGDRLEVNLSRSNPYKLSVEGSETAAEWARMTSGMADSLVAGAYSHTDSVIARYVGANPSSVVSTLLLVTSFNSASAPLRADSLLSLIAPEAKPAGLTDSYSYMLGRLTGPGAIGAIESFLYLDRADSVRTFNPSRASYSLLTVSDRKSPRADSLLPVLRRLEAKKSSGRRLAILDLSLDDDTIIWKRSIKNDSATWRQGWLGLSLGDPALTELGIPEVPYYILCDSTGHQISRGTSISEVTKTIN